MIQESSMPSKARSALVMSVGTVLSRLTGFGRIAALAFALGFTRTADAYNLANVMPNMIYELIMGGILTAVFVPVIVEHLTQKDPEAAWETVSVLTNAALVVLLGTVVLCYVSAPLLVNLQTWLVAPHLRSLVTLFLLFFIPQILLYGLGGIFTGILNARGHFGIPSFAPILNNVLVIGSALLYHFLPGFGVAGLAVGTTLGVALMTAVQIPWLTRLGWRYRWVVDFRHPAVIKILRLAGPLIVYVAFNQVNLTVQNNLAYQFAGGVSALQYGFAFFQLPYGIFAVSISTVLLPALSEQASLRKWDGFLSLISLGLRYSAFIIIPAAAWYVALSTPIVRLLLEHGRFLPADTTLLGRVLLCYALGLFPFTVYLFLNKTYYSIQDTKTPMILNAIGNAANIILNVFVVRALGVLGLALAFSCAYAVIAAISMVHLKGRFPGFAVREIGASVVKFALVSVGSGLVAFAAFRALQRLMPAISLLNLGLNLGLAVLLGVGVYLGFGLLARWEEPGALWQRWARRGNSRGV
jgi:putative peptidoglycan lipid II flippase